MNVLGTCPSCGYAGTVNDGCPTCPGFWYSNDTVTQEVHVSGKSSYYHVTMWDELTRSFRISNTYDMKRQQAIDLATERNRVFKQECRVYVSDKPAHCVKIEDLNQRAEFAVGVSYE